MATTSNRLRHADFEHSRVHNATESLKSLAEAIKAAFFAILLLLLFIPPVTKRLLKAYGLKIAGVSSKDGVILEQIVQSQNDTKAAGTAIVSNQQQLPQIKETLQSVLSQVKDEKVKAQVSTALQGVNKAVDNNAAAVSSVSSAIVSQSGAYRAVTTSSALTASPDLKRGWVYLGRIDSPKQAWIENGPLSVTSAKLPLTRGQTLTLASTTLIRGNAEEGQHSQAAVVGALPANSRLVIETVEESPGTDTDWFVWVKIQESQGE